MRKIQVLIFSIALSSLALAQAPGKGAAKGGGRGAPAVPGYEISTDRKVTFKLRAPEATTVTVAGDFGHGAQTTETMTKGQDGVWSATIGPLRAAIYHYRFTVDGVGTNDPSNPMIGAADRAVGSRYSKSRATSRRRGPSSPCRTATFISTHTFRRP